LKIFAQRMLTFLQTKRLPMEEIGALFGDSVAVYLTNDRHGVIEATKSADEGAEHVELADTAPKVTTTMD
jgi:hypothetical protein